MPDSWVSSARSTRPTAGTGSPVSLSGEWRQTEGDISRAASLYAIKSKLNLFSNFTYFLDNPVHGDQFEQAEERVVLGSAPGPEPGSSSWPPVGHVPIRWGCSSAAISCGQ